MSVAVEHYQKLLDEMGDLPLLEGIEQRLRLGAVFVEWDRLEQADVMLSQAMDFAQRRQTYTVTRAHLCLVRLHRARNELDRCAADIDAARESAETMGNVLHQRWTAAERARLHLLTGNVADAVRWADDIGGADDLHLFEREVEALVLARVELARGRAERAARLVDRLLQRAEQAGQTASAIAILTLRAVVQDTRGDSAGAAASLSSALERGAAGGFRRIFLDEGQPIVPILRRIGGSAALLADAVPVTQRAALAIQLSARERDVLRLLDRGLSNREIAEQLVVAPNTIKTHLRNIGVKLAAGSRTQLLARARDEGLLQ